jgi:hypothetical protein
VTRIREGKEDLIFLVNYNGLVVTISTTSSSGYSISNLVITCCKYYLNETIRNKLEEREQFKEYGMLATLLNVQTISVGGKKEGICYKYIYR